MIVIIGPEIAHETTKAIVQIRNHIAPPLSVIKSMLKTGENPWNLVLGIGY